MTEKEKTDGTRAINSILNHTEDIGLANHIAHLKKQINELTAQNIALMVELDRYREILED